MIDTLLDSIKSKIQPEKTKPITTPVEKVSDTPANALEAAVQQAPSVITELKRNEEQLRQEALNTMQIMEAARVDKGNFCVTLGEGDTRAVLLVAPVVGVRAFVADSEFPEFSHATRADYVLLTANGPRRVSFFSEGRKFPPEFLEREREEQAKFQEFIDLATSSKDPMGVNLKNSSFKNSAEDGLVSYNLELKKPGSVPDSKTGKQDSIFRVRGFAGSIDNLPGDGHCIFGVARDEVANQVLKNSLAKVQSPLRSQVESARSQIQTVGVMRQGVK
jgi:hypothetical protein